MTDELIESCKSARRDDDESASVASGNLDAKVMDAMLQRARKRLYDDDDLEFRDEVEAIDHDALLCRAKRRRVERRSSIRRSVP